MKKHTIKLLTVAITLAAILTLTGCPGPVNPDKPCTHEHTRTEVIEEATYNEDGLGKIICVDCEEVIDEQAEISRFVAGGYDGDIPAEVENPETFRYQYNEEDDYQIEIHVYTDIEDRRYGTNKEVLYFSFPVSTKISEISLISLIHMKSNYTTKTVCYIIFGLSAEKDEDLHTMRDLDTGSPISIILE